MSKTGKTGDAGTADGGDKGAAGSTTPATFENFEAFHKGQSDENRGLIDDHVAGLKSALERKKADISELKTSITKLTADADPELKGKFESLQTTLIGQEKRTKFYEQGIAGRFRNPVSAYATAQAMDVINDDGTLRDAAAFEKSCPELFRAVDKLPGDHNPGRGSGGGEGAPSGGAATMDDAIRRATGRLAEV